MTGYASPAGPLFDARQAELGGEVAASRAEVLATDAGVPEVGWMGAKLVERTAPLAADDEDYGWAHRIICGALGATLEQVGEIADPPDPLPPLAPLLSPWLCPAWALPWLGQWVGVRIEPGTPEAVARALVAGVAGWHRGTRQAMRAAASLFLDPPTGTLWFRERNGGPDPYQLEVVTIDSQTPDPAALEAALQMIKPGGLVLTVRQVEAWDYQQLKTDWTGRTYADLKAGFATYGDLRDKTPI
jgi:hypothetical protein